MGSTFTDFSDIDGIVLPAAPCESPPLLGLAFCRGGRLSSELRSSVPEFGGSVRMLNPLRYRSLNSALSGCPASAGKAVVNAAKKRAKKVLIERFDYSARAHLTHTTLHQLDLAHGLDPNIDKKPFLNGILDALNNLVEEFSNSLEIAMFLAKLWFVLGKYCSVELECDRAISMEEPTDPREEDVPFGSIPGEKPEDRKSYIRTELKSLLQKRVLSCRDYWCSLASEKQDSFRLVGLNSLHEHFDVFYQDDQEAAKTISDALNFVKKNKSWRFCICPYCVGKKIPDIDSLLQHMRNKHPEGGFWTKLLSVLDPKSISDTYQGDHFSDNATICQDSEENYVLHFKRMDDIFKYLFLRAADKIEEKPFSQIY